MLITALSLRDTQCEPAVALTPNCKVKGILSIFVPLRYFEWVTNVGSQRNGERRGKPGQARIRHKQPAPHPAVAGRVPSIYSVPRLTWLSSALRRVLYFAFGSCSLVTSRTGIQRKSAAMTLSV